MLENLRLAVKRQKKLILIFLLTIFIPSISLSIFGIRAIRNERFRLAQQIENEHRRAAELLKSQISARFKELGSLLLNLAQSTVLLQRDAAEIKNLFEAQFAENPLVDQVFVAFEKEAAWFPLFQPYFNDNLYSSSTGSDKVLQSQLNRAEANEFKDRNYTRAISLYKRLADLSPNPNFKAQMLANISRCLVKAENYAGAIQNYQRINEIYPERTSSAGIPFALYSQLQIASCFRHLDQFQSAFQISFDLYKDILNMRWLLKESQFKIYAALAEEAISGILSDKQLDISLKDYEEEFMQLKNLHQEKLEQWQIINSIRQNIIPELRGKQALATNWSVPRQFHKAIDEKDFLVSVIQIPGSSEIHPVGLLGAKIEEQYFIEHIIPEVLENSQFGKTSNVVISQLSGKILLGEGNPSEDPTTATEFFEDNFPPWKIEIFRIEGETLGALDIKRNFYFWTILTLVVVLISGSILISRTIAHEMAVLKLKSDFVSSVSHEFKSPLTSIKSLAERLRDGKVKDSDRMKEYFSVITQDAVRLMQLVSNILDFSKIEEGKKEYEFEETDVAHLVKQQIEFFSRGEYAQGFEIQTRIPEDIPHIGVDKGALSQALSNLLDNAVKFSSDKKEIEVTLKKENENVFIEVRDWGIGISPSDMDKIFDKFYQGRSTLHQSSKGTGLGLTLVKHTVEAHGGKIIVRSRIGEGSTFSIVLPAQRKRK
jgi:signal transduction histidine kinase/tetratricopeptide (TPR) repeat protein